MKIFTAQDMYLQAVRIWNALRMDVPVSESISQEEFMQIAGSEYLARMAMMRCDECGRTLPDAIAILRNADGDPIYLCLDCLDQAAQALREVKK